MIAVIAPHRHLTLTVMYRVQAPKPVKAMLRPMIKIVDGIKDQQIQHQASNRAVSDARPDPIEMPGRKAH